jgi:hypothetical protein
MEEYPMSRRSSITILATLLVLGCGQDVQPQKPKKEGSARTIKNSKVAAGDIPATGSSMKHAPAESAEKLDGTVRLDAITLSAPSTWNRKQAQSTFVQAEFELPRSAGDEADGRLTVSVAGGSVEANIERWKTQFGSGLETSKQEQFKSDCGEVTLADFTGEFNDQRGPGAPAQKRSGYRMIAAIIPIDGQLHFVKAVGPKKTIESHAEEIRTFARSAKRNS